ncbi:MAG: thioredoxin family protein [Candidatus Ranarchaeia archaeon]
MSPLINEAFFRTGYTWEEYISNVVKRNKEALLSAYNRDHVSIEDQQEILKFKDAAPYWMVIAEDWCYDSVGFLPIIVRMAKKTGAELRIWPRDKNPELMDQYLTHGKRKIPLVVFFDKKFKEIGRWIERPRGAHQLVKDLQADMHKKMRKEYDTGRFASEVVNEIKKIIQRSTASTDS